MARSMVRRPPSARQIRRNAARQGVDISGFEALAAEIDAGPLDNDRARLIAKRLPSEMAKLRRVLGVQPVAVNGSRAQGLREGYFQAALRDGSTGYFQRRSDDCLQAATASFLQMPPDLVPDLLLEEQIAAGCEPDEIERNAWALLAPWLDQHGLAMMLHPTPPTTTKRWIGVTYSEQLYSDHCLLMTGRDVIFDPWRLLPPGKDHDASPYTLDDVAYGITYDHQR
jgi:hypothetical protein